MVITFPNGTSVIISDNVIGAAFILGIVIVIGYIAVQIIKN